MLKDIQSGLSKFFGKRWLPIIAILLVCFALVSYSGSKSTILDRMTSGGGAAPAPATMLGPIAPPAAVLAAGPAPGGSGAILAASAGAANAASAGSVASPSDLLPKDSNSQWSEMNPVSQGDIALPDLLQAGYHVGLNSIGQTLKNPNLQLRSDPIIEKSDVGPWNNSTFEADYGRVPMELGYGAR
jgi:hypothetical protein